MARCLVTGHKGYIGEHLYKKLKELGHEVQGIDLFENHNILHDLREYNAPMQGQFHPHYYDFKPEYIFHLACIPRVSYSVEHPVSTMENNVLARSEGDKAGLQLPCNIVCRLLVGKKKDKKS